MRCLDDTIAGFQITEPSGKEAEKNHPKHVNTSTQLGEKYIQQNQNDDSDKNQEHSFSLVNAYQNRKKQWVFELDNGQLWQQNEARYLPSPKLFPVKVTISEGMFGAYNLRAEYINKTVKVKRTH